MKEYKPTGYDLCMKDLYHSNSAFKFYCDYYKGCQYSRFMFLGDFVDWANGGDYIRHCHTKTYYNRCDGWIASAKDIESYMDALEISVEDAFSCWYANNFTDFNNKYFTEDQLKIAIKYDFSIENTIRGYLDENPNVKKAKIIRETVFSKKAVYKWYNKIKEELS